MGCTILSVVLRVKSNIFLLSDVNIMTKSFGLEEGVGHRVLVEHPKEAANWVHRILS